MIPFSDATVHRSTFPIVNLVLIVANALVFLYELQVGGVGVLGGGGGGDITAFFFKWGFIPEELHSGEPFTALRLGRFAAVDIESPIPTLATLFTSMFIHGGLLHFAGNMMFLWVFGDNIEDRVGHLKYLLFYAAVGTLAVLAHYFVDPQSETPVVGASGAISGVMGAYLLMYPFNRIRALIIFFFITAVELPALVMLGLWFALQLFNGFASLGTSHQVDVAFFAHIGGFVAGAVIIGVYKLFNREPLWPRRRRAPGEYWYRR